MSVVLGPYTAGELPPQLVVTFKDSAGNPIDLTGYTAEFAYRSYGGSWVTRTGAVAGVVVDGDQVTNKGQVHYTWIAADMAVAADVEGNLWVGNAGTQRFASIRLRWQIVPAVLPVPTI